MRTFFIATDLLDDIEFVKRTNEYMVETVASHSRAKGVDVVVRSSVTYRNRSIGALTKFNKHDCLYGNKPDDYTGYRARFYEVEDEDFGFDYDYDAVSESLKQYGDDGATVAGEMDFGA